MHVPSTLGIIIAASLLPASRPDEDSFRSPPDISAGVADARPPTVAAICVEHTQPAWILLYGMPLSGGATACAWPDMERVGVRELPGLRRRLQTWLIHEEQPESRVIERVLALVDGQPGMPVGLTWDGSMAFTANDYTAAERRLTAYRADPHGYAAEHWQAVAPLKP
jgi:hypothetical protein